MVQSLLDDCPRTIKDLLVEWSFFPISKKTKKFGCQLLSISYGKYGKKGTALSLKICRSPIVGLISFVKALSSLTGILDVGGGYYY